MPSTAVDVLNDDDQEATEDIDITDPSVPLSEKAGMGLVGDLKVGIVTEGDMATSKPQVLSANELSVIDGVILTSTITGPDPELYGLVAITSTDDERISSEELDVVVGAVGGDIVPTAEEIAAVQVLASASVGLGYLPVWTNTSTGADVEQEKMFFHYSTLLNEPRLSLRRTNIQSAGEAQRYEIESPFVYSSEERNGLRSKFGVDVTLTTDDNGFVAEDVLNLSLDAMAQQLYTTYAVSEKIFPRTPPLKIRPSDVALLSGGPRAPQTTPSADVPTVTATTEAVTTTTGTSGGGSTDTSTGTSGGGSTDTSVFGSTY